MDVTLIYPHQLSLSHPGLRPDRPLFIVEEPLFLTEFPIHRQKLLFHYLTIRDYASALQAQGYNVTILTTTIIKNTEDTFAFLAAQGVTTIHLADTTDDWLERRITTALTSHGLIRHSYESPLFHFSASDATSRYLASKRHMARFYGAVRHDTGILMNDNEPEGGRLSYDDENRKSWPKNVPTPQDPLPRDHALLTEATHWLSTLPNEHYGEATLYLPTSREGALAWLKTFITASLPSFGPYEDAIIPKAVRLHHSLLSPLLNCGLLSVHEVLDAVLEAHNHGSVPIASTEGFVRQLIGWREFIRAAYLVDGKKMRCANFWRHTAPLPRGAWNATTSIEPLDNTIRKALNYGYTHHIERLMIAGNFFLLNQTHPDEVYRWFMAMYIDAYDWVMVPNVYGMSQFADGGIFATKPYISGSNYVRKMSSYKVGTWSTIWDALYWNFIKKHETFFLQNHRLAMMPRLFARLSKEQQASHLTTAETYLQRHHDQGVTG